MTLLTLDNIKDKIERALSLEDEDFVVPSELEDYINDGIDEAEAEIQTLFEDYFLSKATITLVSGQEEYSLPSNIYAFKVRDVIYKNGTKVFEIKRVRDWKKFMEYTVNLISNTGNDIYKYFIYNPSADGQKMILTPTPQESGAYITMWYIRNANNLVLGSDKCDIPEFVSFVIEYGKMRCYEKEGHPNYQASVGMVQRKKDLMIDTLTNMTPDGDNEIEPDYRSYEDQVGGTINGL